MLRLGVAGFSLEQEHAIQAAAAASRITHWTCGPMAGADAWFINGLRAQHLGDVRVIFASRRASDRSLQLQLAEARRPVAFALPLPPTLEAKCTFDAGTPDSILEAIGVLEFALAPHAAQFWLAAQIVDQQEVLAGGAFEMRAKGQTIAFVDMRGQAAVLPSARPANFEVAVWKRVDRERMAIPDNFCRTSIAELMWRYVSRSMRQLLPERYHSAPLYFRRAPRLDPVLVEEIHLLVMRELAIRPATFGELKESLAVSEEELERALAALYYVGSITSTRQRAAPTIAAELPRRMHARSNYGELRTARMPLEVSDLRLMTAPAPLVFA